MPAPNPVENLGPLPEVSSESYTIAGILTIVYGLSELPPMCDDITCLWLLHPRLQNAATMGPIAALMIHSWNSQRSQTESRGLISVAFDLRNHGLREVDDLANEEWRHGNPRHAQDMFGTYHGTALDISLLIDQLPCYILHNKGDPRIKRHLVLGISLGGHCAWQVIFSEPRVEAAIIVIGCPDYMRIMKDRARLSRLETYTSSNGASFFGSKHFPTALVDNCQKFDPKGLLFGPGDINPEPSPNEQERLGRILDAKIKGKSMLICSGGADKLVPYHCSAPFLDFLKKASKEWYSDKNVVVEDRVYGRIGHTFSNEMAHDAKRFIMNILQEKDPRSGMDSSKTQH